MNSVKGVVRSTRELCAHLREAYLAWTVSVLNGPPLRSLDEEELAAREFFLKAEALGLDVEKVYEAALPLAAAGVSTAEVAVFARMAARRAILPEDVRVLRERGYRIEESVLYRARLNELHRRSLAAWMPPQEESSEKAIGGTTRKPEPILTGSEFGRLQIAPNRNRTQGSRRKKRSKGVDRLAQTLKDAWNHLWGVLEEWWAVLGLISAAFALYATLIAAHIHSTN